MYNSITDHELLQRGLVVPSSDLEVTPDMVSSIPLSNNSSHGGKADRITASLKRVMPAGTLITFTSAAYKQLSEFDRWVWKVLQGQVDEKTRYPQGRVPAWLVLKRAKSYATSTSTIDTYKNQDDLIRLNFDGRGPNTGIKVTLKTPNVLRSAPTTTLSLNVVGGTPTEYKWLVDGIQKSTSATYTLSQEDYEKKIECIVTI